MTALAYTAIPLAAVILGAVFAVLRPPGPGLTSAVQHLAAGVVFAAAAAEILPQVVHGASPAATLIGGAAGVVAMLGLKSLEERFEGPFAMLGAVGVDILVDGLVLGLAFIAGAKAGILLTVALALEVLFLGVTVTEELGARMRSRLKIVGVTALLGLMMPLGVLAATPIAMLPPTIISGFLSFGLIALLYLVTEELLVEAHAKPDSPLISAMFFVGFLALLLLEELIS